MGNRIDVIIWREKMTAIPPMVLQLKFTRDEFKRALKGLSEEDASKRLLPMNCISWNVGHLAWQEQKYILYYGQGQMPYPEIDKVFAYGAPASMPSMRETLILWQKITQSTNAWLETMTSEKLQDFAVKADGTRIQRTYGSLFQRQNYHYSYPTPEKHAL